MRGWRFWRKDASGVASVEFAIVLPVMIALVMGGFAVTTMVLTYRKVCDTTTEIADILSELGGQANPNIVLSTLSGDMSVGPTVMYPLSGSNMTVTVGLVNVCPTGSTATGCSGGLMSGAAGAGYTYNLAWLYQCPASSCSSATATKLTSTTIAPSASEITTLTTSSSTNIPTAAGCTTSMSTPCYSYLWVRTDYSFQAGFGGTYIGGTIPMNSSQFIQPREVAYLNCTNDTTNAAC